MSARTHVQTDNARQRFMWRIGRIMLVVPYDRFMGRETYAPGTEVVHAAMIRDVLFVCTSRGAVYVGRAHHSVCVARPVADGPVRVAMHCVPRVRVLVAIASRGSVALYRCDTETSDYCTMQLEDDAARSEIGVAYMPDGSAAIAVIGGTNHVMRFDLQRVGRDDVCAWYCKIPAAGRFAPSVAVMRDGERFIFASDAGHLYVTSAHAPDVEGAGAPCRALYTLPQGARLVALSCIVDRVVATMEVDGQRVQHVSEPVV